ncbi:MAG: aminomethyl-transferring glycine dehydrogenase subunit GcvPA [Polyangiaceae bacterium]|nr:aminomethyl-transferring glycine dehydrogenase subunit GcvPA [Polyangiaceae bacterium]MCW5790753.1 aminomethyl-transferring glycine dehydrogenase subunit GcvPA [Polyangiaceae bacterium]
MRYLPQTDAEIAEMLQVIGKASVDELFDTIPDEARFRGLLNVPPALDEPMLMSHLSELSDKSQGARMLSFLGAGMYAHHIPPAVDQLLLRSEFLTAYTPYQPEVAQGTLQAIWEFQTIVSELFGLPLANASMYDGASAAAEAAQMARRLTKRDRLVVSETVHPEYLQVTRTYLAGRGDEASCVCVPAAATGGDDLEALSAAIDDATAAVIVGYPSFFGALTDLRPLAERAHERDALLISATSEPYALGVAESPGALGVDIAVGEGQALAVPPQFGGPGVGLFACRDDRRFLQQLPGRIAGETTDSAGQRGFVLTLATREQHIRRERATSNICTNQGLIALALAIRTSLLGKAGFQRVAEACLAKASYLRAAILKLSGYEPSFSEAPFFNEFAVRVRGGSAAKVCRALEAEGIIAGYDLGRSDPNRSADLLIAVTERHTVADLDRLVAALDRV